MSDLPPRFVYRYHAGDISFTWGLDFNLNDRITALTFKSNDSELNILSQSIVHNLTDKNITEALNYAEVSGAQQYLLHTLKSSIQNYVGETKAQGKTLEYALCLCHQKSEIEVQSLIVSKTSNPLKLVQDKLKCTLGCGQCKVAIIEMIDESKLYRHKFLGKTRAEWVLLIDQLVKGFAARDEYMLTPQMIELIDVSIYRIKLKVKSDLIDKKQFVRDLTFWIRRQTDFSFSIELL